MKSDATSIAFIANSLHGSLLDRFRELERQTSSLADVHFLFDATHATPTTKRRARALLGDRLRTFVHSEVTDVEYPDPWATSGRRGIVPGNLDLLFLHFARTEPGYTHYWFVEYDVAYTGDWSEVFGAFTSSDADLLGTTLQPFVVHPDWHWWPSLKTIPDLERSRWLRGFFPIVRLSRQALAVVHDGLLEGWSGHYEAVLPTLLRHRGLELEDLGGDGPYVRAGNRNRFYTNTPRRATLAPGTFVYRPARPRAGLSRGRLWHPVKFDQGVLLPYLKLARESVSAGLGR